MRRVPPLLVFALAAALEMAPIHTGWIMIDEFAARFVYFFAGYWLATHVFRFANHMGGAVDAGAFRGPADLGLCPYRGLPS